MTLKDRFLDKKEWLYQLLHFAIGKVSAGVVNLILYFTIHNISIFTIFIGLIIGLIVEIIQYFCTDNRELKIVDRIFDTLSYFLGSILGYVLFYIII